MHLAGDGVPRDLPRAAELYRGALAARASQPPAERRATHLAATAALAYLQVKTSITLYRSSRGLY
eukprot:697230-Prorocentrum_minimum.AAC.1